jgi:NAD(P)-dependent dehydrogenase (short-subunit alcohol dehydrogenase family)
VAVITGAAGGIGLAAAQRFASMGLRVCMADVETERLEQAAAEVASLARGGSSDVLALAVNVAQLSDVEHLKSSVYEQFGEVGILMNNAGVGGGGGPLDGYEGWQRVLSVNLWGVINGVQTFAPAMIEQGTPALIVNTGSKQGITSPPGDTAYNVSKAGIKVLTEGLQHVLRNTERCQVSAHLLVPGFTYTTLIRARVPEKPPGAWLPEQVIDYMLNALEKDAFYIICPDNDVDEDLDRRRILWAAGDLAYGRPALSRWHPDFAEEFARFVKG